MVEDRFCLLAGDAGKPFQEVIQPGAGLQVLEERFDGHAGAAEDPGAADPIQGAFDSGALRPVQHRSHSTRETGELPEAAPRRQRAAGLRVGSAAEAAYEHQNPVEYGLTWKQVLELGLVVVPQALQRQ